MSYETDDKLVSHPDHYKSGKYEVIDIIDEFTKDLSGTEAVCTANAIKYILRWKKKNGIQDVKKAIWYLQHLVDKDDEEERLTREQRTEFNELIRNQLQGSKHTCGNCAYSYCQGGIMHCGNDRGVPCREDYIIGKTRCPAWESIEEPENQTAVKPSIDDEPEPLKLTKSVSGVYIPEPKDEFINPPYKQLLLENKRLKTQVVAFDIQYNHLEEEFEETIRGQLMNLKLVKKHLEDGYCEAVDMEFNSDLENAVSIVNADVKNLDKFVSERWPEEEETCSE